MDEFLTVKQPIRGFRFKAFGRFPPNGGFPETRPTFLSAFLQSFLQN
jgi:hypothetical protein